jgi:hypothetical protein
MLHPMHVLRKLPAFAGVAPAGPLIPIPRRGRAENRLAQRGEESYYEQETVTRGVPFVWNYFHICTRRVSVFSPAVPGTAIARRSTR